MYSAHTPCVEGIDSILDFIRSIYPHENPVALHAPRFLGREKQYLNDCVDSTYVSYAGPFVRQFEAHIERMTGARNAIAVVNGTAALQLALLVCGVRPGDEVITQALTFAATAAAIKHAQAEPAFVDVDRDSLGMSPDKLEDFLKTRCVVRDGELRDKSTDRRIAAVVPMHTFGHPARIDNILEVCARYDLIAIEDAAESIGSSFRGKSTGTFGKAAILSFNGNKPVTTGGGGMVLTDDDCIAQRIRHLSTTAKREHPWEFFHDEVGYNLRMPNVNAALGCAQMEYFHETQKNKRETASKYRAFFDAIDVPFVVEKEHCVANYWLNAILLAGREQRDFFLGYSNHNGVQTRPIWTLLNKLPPYSGCPRGDLFNSEWLEERVVSIPSSVRLEGKPLGE